MKNNGPVKLYTMSLSDCVYLSYLNTAPIGVKLRSLSCVWKQVLEFFGNTFVQNSKYLFRLKISLAQPDERDENPTRPTSDLTRKYEQASGCFEA